MKAKGKTILRVAGFLELIFGLTLLGLMFYITSADKSTSIQLFGSDPNGRTFFELGVAWLQAGFSIIAGIVGIALAGNVKASKLCMFFGLALILIAFTNTLNAELNVQTFMKECFAYLVPALYYWGASKNRQS